MRRIVLALELQNRFSPPEMVVQSIRKLQDKYPVIATLFLHEEELVPFNRLINWQGPVNDNCVIETPHTYNRHGYHLPAELLALLKKNEIDEVLIVGGHNEAFLFSAGFAIFDLGIKTSLVAPLCLSGQFHQMSVMLNIWEHSLGKVYDNIIELGIS